MILNEDGSQSPAIVTSRGHYENGEYVEDGNGDIIEYVADGKPHYETEEELRSKADVVAEEKVEAPTEQQPTEQVEKQTEPKTENAEEGAVEKPVVQDEQVEAPTETKTEERVEIPTEEKVEEQKQSALERIPKNEKGEPVYEQTDADTAWDAIVEQTDGDVQMAKDVADSMVADKQEALKQAEKAKPKKGVTPAEKIAAAKQRQQNIDNAKAELEHWQNIAATQKRRAQAAAEENVRAEQQRIAEEEQRKVVEQRRQEIEAQKAEQARLAEERRRAEAEKANTEAVEQTEKGSKENSAPIEQKAEPKPIGKGVFGNIYDQFKGKVKEAFDFLMKQKSGDLLGVFHRDGVGDIDLVWGDDKGGLKHIIKRHIEEQSDFKDVNDVQQTIADVIKNGNVVKENQDKINFEHNGYRVSVRKNIRDSKGNVVENKNWVVTAFDKSKPKNEKKNSSSSETLTTPSANQKADGVALPSNDESSVGKGSKTSASKQAEAPKAKPRTKQKLSQKSRAAIESIADKMGYKVVWHETLEDNGFINHTKKEIHLAADAEKPVEAIFGHEATHAIRRLSEADYHTLRDTLKKLMGDEWWNEMIERKRKAGYSEDKLEEEVTADAVGDTFFDEEKAVNLARELEGKPNILAKLRETWQRIIAYLKSVGESAKLRQAENSLAAFDAIVNSFKSAKEKADHQTKGNADFSKRKEGMSDVRTMTDEEKGRRGVQLLQSSAVNVEKGLIKKTEGKSARQSAIDWWKENVGEPQSYETEVGVVDIDERSVGDSLAHGYNQAKLDAVTSLNIGFNNAVYLGTLPDFTRQEGVNNHYFAYPINYDGKRNYVFCRAMQDNNKNRLYVHEVFVADRLDNEGNTLQTAAFQPHGGIALYKSILSDVLSKAKIVDDFDNSKLSESKQHDFSKRDEEYLEAVERGDMELAQRMVNEAAEAAGYSRDSSYQGTSAFNGTAPWGNAYFLTKEERKAAWDNDEYDGDQTLGDYIHRGIDAMNLDFVALDPRHYRAADNNHRVAISNVRNAIQKKSKMITMYRSVPADVKEGSFRNGDWVTPSRGYAIENAKVHGWGDDYRIIEQKVPVDEIWWDGNDIAEWGYGKESDFINDTDFAYKNTQNNRKLLDAVTYDDNGNVIPLSRRFNEWKDDVRFSKRESSAPLTERERTLRDALVDQARAAGLDVAVDEQAQQVLDAVNDARYAKRVSEQKQWKSDYVNAYSAITGRDKKTVRNDVERMIADAHRDAKKLYEKVLAGNVDDVTLQQLNDYIDNATPRNKFYRPISKRLPSRALFKVQGYGRTNVIDALYSRICESAVPKNGRTSAEGRRKIEARKEELLEGWAKASGNWHESVADFTSNTTAISSGTDSDVYLSDDGKTVIKASKGKFDNRKFPSDIDQVALFNYVFPGSAYRILGYGKQDGKFVKFLEQRFVDFSTSTPLTTEERVAHMHKLGFEPFNKEKTVFSNGEIVVSDLQKSNIVRDKDGNIRVIDADVKLHTKDIGGEYTYPDVETDTEATIPDGARFLRTKDGEAYGFTVDGKIYLDPRIATSETAIHEYTHLFSDMVRTTDSKQWNHLVGQLKGSELWNEVKERYPELTTDDEIADEVFSTFSGRRGAERLRKEAERITQSNQSVFDKAKAMAVLQNVRDAIRQFWNKVAEMFGIHRMRSAEELADMSLAELIDSKNPTKGESNNNVRYMGSRTDKRMAEIGKHYEGKKLSDEQRAIVDVFSGKKDRQTIQFTNKDGKEHRMLFVQGNEMKAGTKHAVYRHYNTNEGMFNADEIKKVHETLLLGKHSGKDGKIEYVYTDNNNGVEYTVAAEKKGGKERFVSFYTNRKAPTSNLQNTQLSAQADKDAFNSAKVEENAENSNSASENVRYSKREPLQRREGESIFAYADRVVDEDAARINRANGVDFSKREEADIDRSQREGDDSAKARAEESNAQ